jgi:hypothetical protein
MCDRVLVLARGRLAVELSPASTVVLTIAVAIFEIK